MLTPGLCLPWSHRRFKNLADKKKGITDEDLLALMSDELHQPNMVWELLDLQVRCRALGAACQGLGCSVHVCHPWPRVCLQVVCGTMGMPTATVQLKGPDGIARISVGVGTGARRGCSTTQRLCSCSCRPGGGWDHVRQVTACMHVAE